MIEAPGFCPGKERECDDTHCFLGVICAMTMRHPRRAEDLQLAKKRLDKVGCKTMERHEKQKHQ